MTIAAYAAMVSAQENGAAARFYRVRADGTDMP
jgi:hypothetical protein